MSQEGQDAQESHDHTTTTTATTTNRPLGLTNTANSKSSSNSIQSSEKNSTVSKQAKPALVGVDAATIGGKGNHAVAIDRVEVGGEGGRDRGSSRPKSRSSSDGGDHEIKDAVAGSGEGGVGSGNDKRKGAGDIEHEMHIWTERERRKKMKNMFSSLRALLPRLPDKTDKASIVGEAIHYIKTLQETLQKLEKVRLERMREQKRGCEVSASAPPRPEPAAKAPETIREAALADMVQGWNTQQAAAAGGAPRNSAPAAPGAATAPPLFQTWLGPNIVLNTAGDEAFITLSTPRQRGVFTAVLSVLEKHRIDVVTATVSSDQDRSLFNLHARINGASGQVSGSLTPEDKYKLAVSEMMIWLSN